MQAVKEQQLQSALVTDAQTSATFEVHKPATKSDKAGVSTASGHLTELADAPADITDAPEQLTHTRAHNGEGSAGPVHSAHGKEEEQGRADAAISRLLDRR